MVHGFPGIFFAAATNSEPILRTWIAHGGDVQAVHESSKGPLLAFAIIHSEIIQTDAMLTVTTLLSLGASPVAIPARFYTPYHQDLLGSGPASSHLTDTVNESHRWCTEAATLKLARTANLTHRYYLEKAAHIKEPSDRRMQVA